MPAEERQQKRRRRLVEAAIAVFGERGYHAATVREVCVQARLTERYFYESFKSMAELFAAAYAEVLGQLKQRTLPAIQAHAEGRPLQMAEAGLRVFFEYVRDHPSQARILLVDALSINQDVLQLCGDALHEYTALAGELLARSPAGAPAGQAEPGLLAAGLIGFNIHVATAWLLEGCATPLDRVVQTALLAYRMLEAPPAVPPGKEH